jgi:two-component system, NtrC family, nitrogen regulation sensor histidine kinase NtrY
VTLRQKILLLFALTVMVVVTAVTWTVSNRVEILFQHLDENRTTALVNQFLHEYQRRADEVSQRVERLAKEDRLNRTGYDLAHGGDPAFYVTEAEDLAPGYQLDYLQLLQPDGTIISSAQWPAHFGYKDSAASTIGTAAFLKEEKLDQDRTETGVFAVRALSNTEPTLYIVGGERLDGAFLSDLSTPAGATLYLYRNSSPAFDASNLLSAGASVSEAVRYQDVIDRTRVSGIQSNALLSDPNSDSASLNLTAVPLKARDGSVVAVLLVASSRKELTQALGQIRDLAYGVASAGILFSILASLWIAARISRPVEQLAQAAHDVSAGNWDVQVPVASNDELGLLADAFNRMTRELVSQRDRLIQSERVAAWRELARRLAHELKNPLFPLQLTVENMIRARAVSPAMFDEVFNEGAIALTAEIANLKTIIARFSDFSKMPKPQVSDVDLRDVLTRVVRFYEPTLQSRQHPIALVTNLPAQPLTVSVDPELMHRAVSNLVLNAMDAMPEGGTLTISALRSEKNIRMTIADTGHGMTAEERERLFTPYYTTKQEGTGLGLAIVQSVIADHHGAIAVESTPGGGTAFVIDLSALPGNGESR